MEFFLPLYYPGSKQIDTLFDFLPQNCCLIHYAPELEQQARDMVQERILNNFAEAESRKTPALPPDQIFLLPDETEKKMQAFARIQYSSDADKADVHSLSATNHQILKQNISLQRKERGLIPPLSEQIRLWQNQGDQVLLCCRSQRQTKTLAELLEKHQHQIEFLKSPISLSKLSTASSTDILYLCDQPLSEGFSLSHTGIHFLSESELFGEMRLGKRRKAKESSRSEERRVGKEC